MDNSNATLHVAVQYGWRRFTDAEFRQCQKRGSDAIPDSLLPMMRTYTLVFHFAGNSFQLDRASAAAKRIVEAVHE